MTTTRSVILGVATIAFWLGVGWAFLRACKKQQGPLRRATLVGLFLAGVEVLSSAGTYLGFLILIVAVPLQLGMSAWHAMRRQRKLSLAHLSACGVYVLSVLLVGGYIRFNNSIAEQRAEVLIAACKAYQAQHGKFPDHLEDLVPAFLIAVPRAKDTLALNHFTYEVWSPEFQKPYHVLWYYGGTPFGRPLYIFEEDRWSTLRD